MFLTLSSDHIQRRWPQWSETLPFFQIEKNFWPWMVQLVKKQHPKHIFILNWPWSFTTLRVCCLALNIIKQHFWITYYTTTKPALFQSIAQKQCFPETIGLTIWQKHNCWLLETKTQQYKKISYTDRYEQWILIDPIQQLPESLPNNAYDRILQRKRDDTNVTVILKNNAQQWLLDFSDSCRKKVETLEPCYLIDPT